MKMNRLWCAFAALLACSAAMSADLPATDAAALQSIARANFATANALELGTCASERSAVATSASGCTNSACRIAIAAIAALTPCAAARAGSIVATQTAAPAQIIQSQREITVAERIVGLFAGGFSKLFDTAIAVAPSILNYKLGLVQSLNAAALGTVQSNNATALGVAQSNNALAGQQSTNGAFAAFGTHISNTASAGFASNQGIAASGFNTVGTVAAAGVASAAQLGQSIVSLASRPTTQITTTGDGNNIVTGDGNTTQSGSGNRIGSSGPCTAGNGGNTSSTPATGTTPTTTTPATTTGGKSDCAQ